MLFLLNDVLPFDPCFLPLLCFFSSWDDSSSVSSGISDTIDNLSTDDINTSSSISSYANTPASSRKNLDAQVRALDYSSNIDIYYFLCSGGIIVLGWLNLSTQPAFNIDSINSVHLIVHGIYKYFLCGWNSWHLCHGDVTTVGSCLP